MSGRLPARAKARKLYRRVIPAFVILAVGISSFWGYLTYRITHPAAVPEGVNPSQYLLPSLDVSWTTHDGLSIAGWWIPGRDGVAPVILAPGYGMSRSDVLSLASALHAVGFNVLVYDTRGCGAAPRGACMLGAIESEDLLTAIRFLKTRRSVPSDRVGIWGVDVNARAALQAAVLRSEVRAIAADSGFDSLEDFMNIRIREDFGWDNRVVQFGCMQALKLYALASGKSTIEGVRVGVLGDRSLLFLEGENRPELARLTTALYSRVRPQKELVTLSVARTRMMNDVDARNYDRQVTNFFQLNLLRSD